MRRERHERSPTHQGADGQRSDSADDEANEVIHEEVNDDVALCERVVRYPPRGSGEKRARK